KRIAIVLPPCSLPVNSQFLRLCRDRHKRKNWEFLGSEPAGPCAAVLFTILAGAKRHRLEPWAYLHDVWLRLSAGGAHLESLLPDRWAASHPQHVLEHRLDESRRKAARQRRRVVAQPKV